MVVTVNILYLLCHYSFFLFFCVEDCDNSLSNSRSAAIILYSKIDLEIFLFYVGKFGAILFRIRFMFLKSANLHMHTVM